MIDILMACYNNEKYVAEQIESILQQTNKDWRLTIQDDCSTDGTYAVLKKYQELYQDKIILKRNLQNSGGAKNNFFSMMLYAKESYVMFSDGDDFWLPEKIQKTFDKMKTAEIKYGADTPVLVHTDLKIADKDLNIVAKSMFDRQKIDPDRDGLNQLLVQNIVTGCTCMMNQNLMTIIINSIVGKSQEEKAPIMMHDWWIALAAATFGRIECLKETTMLYRQHGNNSVGAKDAKSIKYILEQIKNGKHIKSVLGKTYLQAEAFDDCFKDALPNEAKHILANYQAVSTSDKAKKIVLIIKYGFLKNGVLRAIGQLLHS